MTSITNASWGSWSRPRPMVGAYSDWTPLDGRSGLFPEDVDATDPWQFRNVIVR